MILGTAWAGGPAFHKPQLLIWSPAPEHHSCLEVWNLTPLGILVALSFLSAHVGDVFGSPVRRTVVASVQLQTGLTYWAYQASWLSLSQRYYS